MIAVAKDAKLDKNGINDKDAKLDKVDKLAKDDKVDKVEKLCPQNKCIWLKRAHIRLERRLCDDVAAFDFMSFKRAIFDSSDEGSP